MEIVKRWNKNFQELERQDAEAKKNGTLVGRYIREQIADGYAFYQVVKENKATVKIQVVRDIGDDWTIPYWGNSTTIAKSYVLKKLYQEEKLAEIFAKGR